MWLLLLFFATVVMAFARILQKSLLKTPNHDPITYAIYFQVISALLLLPLAIIHGFPLPPMERIWPFLLLTIGLYSVGNIFAFRALRKIPVSEFIILTATIPIWAMISSAYFLHESIGPIKILGIFLTIVGISFAFYHGKRFVLKRDHYTTLLAAILWGFAFTNDGYLLQSFDATTYSFVYWFLPGIALGALYYKKLPGISHFVKDDIWKLIAPSALFAVASIAITTSYKLGGQAGQIATILQFGTILTIIFGLLFLHERANLRRKLIGGIIVVLGVILVQIK